MGDIGEYFDKAEFSCKCGCGYSDIFPILVNILDQVRENIDRPLIITSGCRCAEHNDKIGGKENSSHLYGLAVDIKTGNSRDRFKIILYCILLGVSRVGIGKDFTHIDVDHSKPQQVIWLY